MPKKRTRNKPNNAEDHLKELRALFDSDSDDEVDFPGFDTLENTNLTLIFQEESDTEEFFGF